MSDRVIDVSWSKPSPAAVKAAGYAGVIGYLSHDASKTMSGLYRDECFAHDLLIGLVFEDAATRALGGHVAGMADGQWANAEADALHWPADRPIYYAVDFDVAAGQVNAVLEYLTGAHDARPSRPAGLYGGRLIIDAPQNTAYRWQTEAWSGAYVSPHACLYQRVRPTAVIAGVSTSSYDEDVVLRADWGGWHPAAPAPPPPPPTPSPEQVLQAKLAQARALGAQIVAL